MIKVGSARVDENGKYSGGKAGDQTTREVSEQSYYTHTKGWNVIRANTKALAQSLAKAMKSACDNDNIGYSQSDRFGVINAVKQYGSLAKIAIPVNADCSSLVRACCIECGFDPGNFTTANEAKVLEATGKFLPAMAVSNSSMLRAGDILVTKTKGHTVIVTDAPATTYLQGIDVSSYQGNIDWKRVKANGWEFAILKIIRKDLTPDKMFEQNWAGCLNADILIYGVYNYLYAKSVEDAEAAAKAVLAVLNGRHTRVFLDYEDKSLPKDKLAADIINAYGDIITRAGCEFGVYFGKSYYDSYLSKIMQYVKSEYKFGWEARYYNGYNSMNIYSAINEAYKPDNFDGELLGWQYSSAGQVDGISGKVDLNAWYVNTESAVDDKIVDEDIDTIPYTLSNFISDSRKVFGLSATASAAELVNKTVTVSTKFNQSHPIVTPLERYMASLGYYTGTIEADKGKTPCFGNGMKKAIMLYQQNVVKATPKNCDGILTVRGATWKKLYGSK